MNIQISSPVTWQRWSVCWPRGRDEILKLGVSTGMGPPSVGPLGFWLKIESRVAAPTMQVHFCILKIAITIHFVWRTPDIMRSSLASSSLAGLRFPILQCGQPLLTTPPTAFWKYWFLVSARYFRSGTLNLRQFFTFFGNDFCRHYFNQ